MREQDCCPICSAQIRGECTVIGRCRNPWFLCQGTYFSRRPEPQPASPTAESIAELLAAHGYLADPDDRARVAHVISEALGQPASESAESKISTSVILPSSESAEELARAIQAAIDEWIAGPPDERTFQGIVATLIAAHDAETLRKAADEAIPALCRICEREWGQCPNCNDPCDWKTELSAAILGEGKA